MSNNIPVTVLPNSPEGIALPKVGFGVAAMEPELLKFAIKTACEDGYRYFDLAPEYGNEAEVGEALRNSGIPREELFISTKLEGRDHAYEKCLAAIEYSMKKIGVDYLDCYLIHWPMPEQDLYCEAWRAMEDMYLAGKIKTIGLSNFKKHHIEKIMANCRVKPMVNELEVNPYNTQAELVKYCQSLGIQVVNWFPMGGPRNPLHPYPVEVYRVLMDEPVLKEIGDKYGKSIGQVALRWAVEKGLTPIPKSSNAGRIMDNCTIFDFSLTEEEIAQIDALNHDRQFGPDSDTYNEFIDLSNY